MVDSDVKREYDDLIYSIKPMNPIEIHSLGVVIKGILGGHSDLNIDNYLDDYLGKIYNMTDVVYCISHLFSNFSNSDPFMLCTLFNRIIICSEAIKIHTISMNAYNNKKDE